MEAINLCIAPRSRILQQMTVYVNKRWVAAYNGERRSRTSILLMFGTVSIHATIKLQKKVSKSSGEAEYTSTVDGTELIEWPKKLLKELNQPHNRTTIHQASTDFAERLNGTSRSTSIDKRH